MNEEVPTLENFLDTVLGKRFGKRHTCCGKIKQRHAVGHYFSLIREPLE